MSGCRGRWRVVAAAVVAMLWPGDVPAQTSPTLPSTRVFVTGPVSWYPQIALKDAGSDSNVFNETTNPRSDLTYSLTPRLFAVTPVGITRFVGTAQADLLYFRTYTQQRSLTTKFDGRYEVTGPGFRPFVAGAFVSRGDRAGFEIDARVPHTQTSVSTGMDLDVSEFAALVGWVRRSWTAYGENAQYLSVELADQLNQESDTAAAGVRYRITPLTTVLFAAGLQRDRFPRLRLRDADSLRVASTLAFDTGAAITGDLQVGVLSFRPRNTAIARYEGLIGSAHLHYTIPDMLRLDIDANRDVGYSYDPMQPYYLESGGRLTVTQRVIGPVELIGIGERRVLHNQRIGGPSFDGRREVTTALGGGLSVRLNDQLRMTLTYEQTKRTATEIMSRNFERTRVLGSFNYGL